MKVGDYVRFDYHRVSTPIQIAKITETHYDSEDDNICYSTDIGLVIDESNLVKEPKEKIIELIEVGDYVNGCKIIDICINEITNLKYLVTDITEADDIYALGYINIQENDIKSIVTKEQFSNMEYKVESVGAFE